MPEPGPERIVLVGFMGSGKSTVGRHLARRLGWGFVDMDERIEERAGQTIAAVFRAQGEAAFRALELEVAREVVVTPRRVIAAGGGAFAQPTTREVLRRSALTVFLECDFETLAARVPADGRRPLAADRDIMRTLLTERLPSYRSADLTVDASDVPDEVAGRIAEAAFPGAGAAER
jgi:shikimate kinase